MSPRSTQVLSANLILLVLTGLACRPVPNRGTDSGRPDSATAVVPPTTPDSAPAGSTPARDTTGMRLSGTVRSVNLEGGCWRFDGDDGKQYEIARGSAPQGLLQDGKKVTLTLKLRTDLMSSCMIGPIVEVVKVED